MRSFLTVILFLALIIFSLYWFNEGNPNRNDLTKVPGAGPYIGEIANNYQNIWNYTSRGPAVLFDGNFVQPLD